MAATEEQWLGVKGEPTSLKSPSHSSLFDKDKRLVFKPMPQHNFQLDGCPKILVGRFSVTPSGLEGWFDHWRSRTKAVPTPTPAAETQCLVLSLALSPLQPPFPRLGCWQGNPKVSKARKLLSPLGLEESRYEMVMPELWS